MPIQAQGSFDPHAVCEDPLTVLIRCDASLAIGSGHVLRCRTLARELHRRGATVTFLCRRQPGDLTSLLEREFPVCVLPAQPLWHSEGLSGRDLYAAWLGCPQGYDAAQCLDAVSQAGMAPVSWLVVDHYGLDSIWEAAMLEGLSMDPKPRLLVIDDLANRPHHANILLDANYFGEATPERYQGLVPGECCQFLGPSHALLGPEYPLMHPLVPARTELRRVLVFFGGVDAANLSGKTLEVLMAPDLAHLEVDVVLGSQSPHRQGVERLVARRPQTHVHRQLPSLAGLITRADLGIGAGGATTWERACLGLPTLVTAIADNQRLGAKELARLTEMPLLCDSDFQVSLVHSMNRVRSDSLKLNVVSERVHQLTEGSGCRLVCDQMYLANG